MEWRERHGVKWLAALAASALLAMGCGGDDPPPADFGFNNNAVSSGLATPEEAADLMARAGGTVDRVQVSWAAIEPEPGRRELAGLDRIYAADRDAGLRPLLVLAYAPAWAAAETPCDAADPSCHLAPAPEHFADFAATAAALAERYPDAAGIEVWNEPNAPYFWAPAPDPAAYSELVAATAAELERAGSDVPLVAGATSDSPGFVAGHVDAADFIAGMADAGVTGEIDALSLHAYPDPGDAGAESALPDLDAAEAAVGDSGPPLWITETGISTTGDDPVTPGGQAEALENLTELLPAELGVEMMLVHTLVQPPRGVSDRETGFGVVSSELDPLPGYCALAESWGGDADC